MKKLSSSIVLFIIQSYLIFIIVAYGYKQKIQIGLGIEKRRLIINREITRKELKSFYSSKHYPLYAYSSG